MHRLKLHRSVNLLLWPTSEAQTLQTDSIVSKDYGVTGGQRLAQYSPARRRSQANMGAPASQCVTVIDFEAAHRQAHLSAFKNMGLASVGLRRPGREEPRCQLERLAFSCSMIAAGGGGFFEMPFAGARRSPPDRLARRV